MITCEAQRVGSFEVESVFLVHPCVFDSAAIGVADAFTTEHVKPYVVLRRGFTASQKLAEEIASVVHGQLSPQPTPREIEFVEDLPKTESGKIQREISRKKVRYN